MVKEFKEGHRYRHKNCLDIDIYVLHGYCEDDVAALEVLYLNRNYQNGNMIIDHRSEKVIFRPNYSMWEKVT